MSAPQRISSNKPDLDDSATVPVLRVASLPQRVPPAQPDTAAPAADAVLTHPNAWLLLVGLGAGLTTWAAFLYLGIRARRRAWLAWAAVYGALAVAGVLLDSVRQPTPQESAAGATALLIAWVVGTVHAAAIRKDAKRQLGRPDRRVKLDAARHRIERRAEGRRLAAKDAQLAREVGVGRPDIPGADDYGLVDVNHTSPAVLRGLPGVTAELAQRIADTRAGVGLFKSADDLGVTLDLAPALIDDLREYAVFL